MGFTFFILLLGALVFTLMQKHEAEEKRNLRRKISHDADVKISEKGPDNIYEFKIYCYNMRCLLELAQTDGIGIGEERNEDFYDKHRDEISKRYCDGMEPMDWAMHKTIDILFDHGFRPSFVFNKEGEVYYDQRERYHGLEGKHIRYKGTWTVYPSVRVCDRLFNESLKGIVLPKDGVTGATEILKKLYYFNHEEKRKSVETFQKRKYNFPTFEESGITLYN